MYLLSSIMYSCQMMKTNKPTLGLFASGIVCDVCGKDPGLHPNNSYTWYGFNDMDNGKNVCMHCKKKYYSTKTPLYYSERPIVMQTK